MTTLLEPGYRLYSGEQLNAAIADNVGPTGPTGSTGPTGPAFSTAGPTFTGTTTVAALTATGIVSMSNASVSMANIPTADPHVAGRLWANSGVVTVSAG